MCDQGEYESVSPGVSTDPVQSFHTQQAPASSASVAPSPPSSSRQPANMRETCHIAIPNYAVGAIIGAGGANIKRIIRDSNAFVTVSIDQFNQSINQSINQFLEWPKQQCHC